MIDERFVATSHRFDPPPDAFERLRRRRDHKRRNQRITAGVVGIAVFVAAVWIVRDVTSLDGSPTSVPGAGTTGQAETGPTGSEPIIGNTGDPSSVGFDPDAPPSEPARGKLVMSDGGIHPYYVVLLFADGRLIWRRDTIPDQGNCCGGVSAWIEQRLTPEGVELLRSGAVELGGQHENPGEQLPVSAWEDPTLRPHVPSRYGVCAESLDLLPSPAADLLRGGERISQHDFSLIFGRPECFELAIAEARALAEILTDTEFKGGGLYAEEASGVEVEFEPLLPDGTEFGPGNSGPGA